MTPDVRRGARSNRHGYPLTCAITFTFGGIRTDSSTHVVSPASTPIPGLCAAAQCERRSYPKSVMRVLDASGGHSCLRHTDSSGRAPR